MALNVKIFSTQRIDKECDRIENEVYVPVRCGAVYDKNNSSIIGDNTGDHISHKRNTYCELTTQYWAWKNVDADYYGFCHYRRYFAFQENKDYPITDWEMQEQVYLDSKHPKELQIDPDALREMIGKYDVIVPYPVDTKKVGFKNVLTQFDHAGHLHQADLELLLEIIEKKYPQYYEAAKKSVFSTDLYLCNMFVMRKDLFQEYSQFLFDVLEEFEKANTMEGYSQEGCRTPGHLGERMVGIYLTYLQMQNKYRIRNERIVVFLKPEKNEVVSKCFEKDSVNIVFSSSEYFAPYCATAIQSIINHASDNRNYDILILEREIADVTKTRLCSMANGRDNISIRVINVARFFSKYHLTVGEHFSVETYFRLMIPDLLPQYDKVLYLDGDLVAMNDVAELYDTDIENYALAGVLDVVGMGTVNGWQPEMLEYYKERVRLKNPMMQFNAGVLLMNLKEIRQQYTSKELAHFAEHTNFKFADQDVLNCLFQDQIKWLDFAWNAPNDQKDNLRGYVATFAPDKIYRAAQEALKHPKIIHFLGTVKPWYEPRYQYAEEYWKVMRDTPFYEIVLHRMITENCWAYTHMTEPQPPKQRFLRRIAGKLLPLGTRRREAVKKLVFKIIGKPYVKPDYMK